MFIFLLTFCSAIFAARVKKTSLVPVEIKEDILAAENHVSSFIYDVEKENTQKIIFIKPEGDNSISMKNIGDYAFASLTSLVEVEFAVDTIEFIGKYAFSKTSVKQIDLSNTNITTLSEGMFKGCEQLESVTLPETVVTIEAHVFEGL